MAESDQGEDWFGRQLLLEFFPKAEAYSNRTEEHAFRTTTMILTGIGDEAANGIDGQIQATKELGWKHLEPRGMEVPGHAKANFHDIPDAAFDVAVRTLE